MTMTREEAIQIIKARFYPSHVGLITNETRENAKALRMAVEALSERTGEWICKGDYAVCSECGGSSGTQFDGVERIPRTTAFCPYCRADMRGNTE